MFIPQAAKKETKDNFLCYNCVHLKAIHKPQCTGCQNCAVFLSRQEYLRLQSQDSPLGDRGAGLPQK